MHVGCFKDELLYFGDKYGTHKHDYRMGEISNISIVRYELNVEKEHREPMTMGVCFDFCRTMEDMSSFGIAHGRDCYCAPYFKQMAGDDSMCDNVCEGIPRKCVVEKRRARSSKCTAVTTELLTWKPPPMQQLL